MDFGGLGLDNLVGPQNGGDAHQSQLVAVSSSPSSSSLIPEKDIKPVVHGSRFIKQGRSFDDEDDKGASKMAKPGDLSGTKMITMPLLHQGTPLLRSNSSLVAADDNNNSSRPQEQMLSFSSTQSEVSFLSRSNNNVGLLEKSPQSKSINFPPYFQPTTASAYARTTGYGGGSLNTGMHGGVLTGINGRSGFSPSQLIELEHQALIFKYIYTNVPVPSNLINPLKKSLYPCGGLSYSSAGSYAPNSYGWGTFHLGYSGNADPEPGRCRRTDGKKWRCSRDAVPDQKYCERHINRGRHRSRKPVEGRLTSAAASGETAATTNAAKVVVPVTSSSLSTTSVVTTTGGGVSSNGLAATRQFKSLQPGGCATAKTSSSTLANRVQTSRDVSMMSPAVDSKTSESTFTFPKQDLIFEDSSNPLFGVVPSDSLLNPSQRTSFLDFTEQQTQDQNLLRQFVDDWPKDDSTRSVISWADELKSDWTQLSMSIPIVSTEFSSSSSSPAQEKLAVSPLRLSSDFDPIQMGLGVEPTPKHADWMSVPWENSMGGPLGEVLTNSTNTNSPQMGSSPTGVLQKSTFCSLSNSSSTSSPRVDNMKGLYEEVLGSGYVSSCNVPAMLPGK